MIEHLLYNIYVELAFIVHITYTYLLHILLHMKLSIPKRSILLLIRAMI